MHTLIDLGEAGGVARGVATEVGITLTLSAPSGFSIESNSYYPAESFTLNSAEAIAGLRQLCEELLDEHATLREMKR